VVVCDRYIDSSVAYQGAGRNLGMDAVRELSLWATNALLPDLTVVLDIDPEIGLSRLHSRDRLEGQPLDYHRRVRQAFLDLAAEEPARYIVIDATLDASATAEQLRTAVDIRLDARR
jgi:dTMP kinase